MLEIGPNLAFLIGVCVVSTIVAWTITKVMH